ncbi:MAG: hypothetical protein LBL41_03295 [Bifidobacteriaceae bacterium]|jgi:hypothetical protein|nr:hypothetical protein [Bifidobacteriaceae bacterium]
MKDYSFLSEKTMYIGKMRSDVLFIWIIIVCIFVGAVIGFVNGGGIVVFLTTGWLHMLVGIFIGALVGIGITQSVQALLVLRDKNKKKRRD